jgi:CRP/FNR family transcriptional regulator
MPIDKVEALRRTPLFAELEPDDLRPLIGHAIERKLAKGEVLFLAGDPPRGLWVIVDGAVRAFRVGADGREQIIHVERAGATVGEVPMFDGGNCPSNAAAEQDSSLLFIPREDVQRALLENPRIGLAALKVLARRIRACANLVETLSLHDVDRRLARLLLGEAKARGIQRGRGMEIEFGLTHQQVASRIGSVREVVSRAFGRLQQAGLVRVEGSKVLILDFQTFQAYAEGE